MLYKNEYEKQKGIGDEKFNPSGGSSRRVAV